MDTIKMDSLYGKNGKLYKYGLSILLVILLAGNMVKAQGESEVISNCLQFTNASNSLYYHLADQAYKQLNIRKDRIAELHSLSDWKHRQQRVDSILRDIIGPFPER